MPDSIGLLSLSDTARRVLGHLPVWTDDEDAFQQAELDAGASESIRAYDLPTFTERLDSDRSTPAMSQEQVQELLKGLEANGLAFEENGWRMTQAGFELLTSPPEVQPANLVGGPAVVELNESQSQSEGVA